jgi:hypothetical protein
VISVTVESDLAGVVYFHWFIDGVLVDSTQSESGSASHTFSLAREEQARVDVGDTTDPDADPASLVPKLIPRRLLLQWVRSLATDVDRYEIEMNSVPVAAIPHDESRWSYSFLTPRLDPANVAYLFKIIPIDRAGNRGSDLTLIDSFTLFGLFPASDAPDFDLTYDAGTDRVTFNPA